MSTTITPDYSLDVAGAQRLEAELAKAEPGDIILDLADVSFVASSGLRVLLKVSQQLDVAGAKLSAINASDLVMEVFEMSGFADFIEVS